MSLEKEFLAELIDAITNDRLTLPTLPEVALRIREAVNDPEVNSETLASVIGQDAALAARIIKVANSPLMRGSVVVDNLQLAITRMGMAFVRNLATGLAMEQMFQATHDAVDKRLRDSWQHSLEVASISHVLASNFTKLKSDQATLAGLVHEIGILPILTLAEENPAILEHEAVLDKIINRLNGKVGRAILKAWEFPEELLEVPSGCTDFSRDKGPVADYVDVVTVAKLQSYPEGENPYAKVDTSTIPAFQKLGLSHEIDVHHVDELAEELEETKQALG
ncbi:HDOD domain-containing protein [Aliikangiella marina]|uniref:HDOD domain-containing protein n=1 Tax=Aliikangiella marina TaxID=1712262 RepID=A0A545T6H4_9GAMM|nr:HDOD domain-containing protein [Aliikangiella marina]TQV72830.1 HDOD domain-containing protein [Aliikangiella marina]